MSKRGARTRLSAPKNAASSLHIKEEMRGAGRHQYLTHCVQGWKEGGKWKRKRFKDLKEAERFAALKRVALENQGRQRQLLLTALTENQIEQAETAFLKLGTTYDMNQAVQFFLENHRPPEHTILMGDAIRDYLADSESLGTRPRTIRQKKYVLESLTAALEDCQVHTVTPQKVKAYLTGLRAKDGITKASRKTWNNYRNDINHFFKWAAESDLATNRPFTFSNPCESIKAFGNKQIADQRKPIAFTPPHKLRRRLTALMNWKNGDLAKYFALVYFAGIRPDWENGEIAKIAEREDELINLETRTIHIPSGTAKTKQDRQIRITDNLAAWLEAYKGRPILPSNHGRNLRRARKAFHLGHDETRHSFISYYVALHRSVGDAALQAGNSESIVKKHYLNLRPAEEGEAYFSIVPDMTRRRAVLDI